MALSVMRNSLSGVVRRSQAQALPRRMLTVQAQKLNSALADVDPEVAAIVEGEKGRQRRCINLIASENFASKAVMECTGSVMTNKYSEGYPGARYYGGNEFIDQSEDLCRKRALSTMRLDEAKWGVNVQTLSGSPANFQFFTAVLNVHDRIMGLDLPHGGHLSHGYEIPGKKISMTSKYFESMSYRLDEETGIIDYEDCHRYAARFRPKIIIAGASAYSRLYDYARMKAIAEDVGAILLADMAHISGLVAAGVVPSPFDHCDAVTTTTHKSLRGPRGAMIFWRKGQKGVDKKGQPIMYDFDDKINAAVFPGLQGGPHNHTITALATALKMAASPEFKEYQVQTLKNSQALGESLVAKGFKLVSGGTDNHLLLVDLRNKGINGNKGEIICEMASIIMNKNTVPGDKSAITPSGLRVGAPAMTSRGLMEDDFRKVGEFIARAVEIGIDVQKQTGPKLKDWKKALETPPADLLALKQDVESFASGFDTVGF